MSQLTEAAWIMYKNNQKAKKTVAGFAVVPPEFLFVIFIFQVNGINTVRIPMSLVPYEDSSASYQRQLKRKKLEQAAADISEAADEGDTVVKAVLDAAMEAEADKDPESRDSEASASAGTSAAEETTASATQTPTAPPSDSQKKD